MAADEEEVLLRSVTLQNANTILLARQRAEQELLRAKEALELKTAELAHSLASMRATLESTTDGILVTDSHRRMTGFNEKFVQMWRLPDELMATGEHRKFTETAGRQFAEPGQYLARIDAIYAQSPTESFDLLELADGRVFERFSRKQFVDGQNVGRVWSFRDITERRQAEETVRQTQVLLQALVDEAPVGIFMVDAELRIRHVNPTAVPIFGALGLLIGRDFAEVVHALWHEAIAEDMLRRFGHTRDTGEPYHVPEFSEPRRDRPGREYYDWQIHRITLSDRTPGVVCYFIDISAHVLARRSLADSEARLRFMAESMPQKIFTARPSGDVDYFNQQWMDFTGLSSEQIFGWGWTQFIHPEDLQENIRRWQQAINTGEPFQFEHRVRRADGVYRWHLSRALAMRNAEAKVLMWIGSTTDIDDVKRAAEEREQLLEAERAARTEAERVSLMKDDFLANLSHELRTPLHAILGWSQLLASGNINEGDLEQGLETIERNARVQTQLIEDLLDMSRIVSGKVRLDVQRMDLASVVDQAVDSVRPSAEAKGIRVRKIIDPLAGPVSGDPNRLQQVVWNLLSNAVKFTPKGGKVEVLVERVNSHLEITVNDSGRGIHLDFLPHVFERFRQADSSTTRQYGGLGLGLAIVKQLVELHGGSVRAKSAGEGQGSTFVVSLPLAPIRGDERREHPASATRAVFDSEGIDLKGVNVLVVDDEPDARSLIERVLTQCQAAVTTAASAAEGLGLLQAEQPDVVVSDIGMPEQDGYEFIRAVRKLPESAGGKTPAVALTAFARSEDRTRAMMAGYQMHISKPIEPQELIATVASLAGRMGKGWQ